MCSLVQSKRSMGHGKGHIPHRKHCSLDISAGLTQKFDQDILQTASSADKINSIWTCNRNCRHYTCDAQGCLITFSESSFIECTGAEPLQRCVSEMMNALEPSSSILRITPVSKKNQDIKRLSTTKASKRANGSICSTILRANNGKH